MRHVIGISSNDQPRLWPLEVDDRMRFDTDDFRMLGYFCLLSPPFERFFQRDAGCPIDAMNVLFALGENDLKAVLDDLTALESALADYPRNWRMFLGEVHPPRGAPVVRIEPMLFRNRALSLLRALRRRISKALDQGKLVVYGNGVSCRHLCGIELPEGTVEYS